MNNKTFNIIISPAKKMNINNDDIISESMPCFMDKTEYLYSNLKDYSYDDLKKLLACNDEIAELNYSRYKDMNLYKNLSPATPDQSPFSSHFHLKACPQSRVWGKSNSSIPFM